MKLQEIRSSGENPPLARTANPTQLPSPRFKKLLGVQNRTHLELVSKLSACLFWVALGGLSVFLDGDGWLCLAVDGLEVLECG